ncbi:unnamed protein product [Paramecium sonneborni]|uniref:Uncharacterized protein n=1 Tax=Paramecium sonneborni TaxID=65129 RepID=A0A8S1M2T6_9CILI|nr:unnamed protein product [Paramecium sonneborni]
MQKMNNESNPIEFVIEAQSSKAPSSQEFEFETQSFTSKEDLLNNQNFKPFLQERDSTGKLVGKDKKLHFLKGQQIVLQTSGSKRLQFSTTSILGLNPRAVTADDRRFAKREPLKNFKLNLQADQGFIKQFREITKHIKPQSQMNSGFLGPHRDYYYKTTKTPGPGVYQSLYITASNPIEFPKSPQISKPVQPVCSKDFYDFNMVQKNISGPSFVKTQSRDSAYQRGIFAQIEIEKRQSLKQKPEEYDEQRIDREIDYLLQQQQKYGKLSQPNLAWPVPLQKIELPEKVHGQWTKMLERYGFKKQTGGRLIKNTTSM